MVLLSVVVRCFTAAPRCSMLIVVKWLKDEILRKRESLINYKYFVEIIFSAVVNVTTELLNCYAGG